MCLHDPTMPTDGLYPFDGVVCPHHTTKRKVYAIKVLIKTKVHHRLANKNLTNEQRRNILTKLFNECYPTHTRKGLRTKDYANNYLTQFRLHLYICLCI